MKRSILSILLCLSMLLGMIPTAFAETTVVCEGTTGDVNYKLTSDGVFTLSGNGATGDGHSNKTGSKPSPWASYLSQIKTLIVEDGVTLIGNNLFRDCVNLTSVSLGNTVASIGQCCFQDCTSLKSIVLPASLTTLKRVAFLGCTALEEVDLGGVQTMGDKVFNKCSNVKKLTIPASLTTLAAIKDGKSSDAFAGIAEADVSVTYTGTQTQWETLLATYDSVLGKEYVTVTCTGNEDEDPDIGEVTVLDSGITGDVNYKLTSDGVLTFSGTGATADYSSKTGQPYHAFKAQIKKVVVEQGVTYLGVRLFYDGCTNLEEVVLADSVTSLGEACFRNCTSLKFVKLPAGFTTLGRAAFMGCTALEEVDLGGVTTIGDKVFTNCSNLTKLTIPATLESLSVTYNGATSDIFAGIASSGVTVSYGGTVEQWKALLETYPASAVAQSDTTVTCVDGTYNGSSEEISVWSEGACGEVNYVLTSDGVLTFSGTGSTGDYTNANKLPYYSYMTAIKRVVVENGVTHLATRLLYGATALEEIFIADSVTSVGEACFRQCSSLKTIILPDGLGTLSRVAFYSCTALEEVDLGETVTVLGDKAFNGCGNLTKLTIPATLTTLEGGSGTDAFNGISINEVNVTYGGTVEQWKALLATYNSVLGKEYVTVTCTDGTYNSGDDSGDTGETTIICEGTTGDVRYKLSSDGVFTLSGTGATGDGHSNATGSNPAPWAAYLDQIKTLVVEEGITLIGNNMFRDAVNLRKVSLPNTLESIGQCCFQGCTSLKTITLPESLTTLKRVAFFGCTALEEVVLAGTYTQLADKIFTKCAKLKKITIPATITSLKDTTGKDAFAGVSPSWKNPVTVTYGGTIEQWKAMLEAYPDSVLGKEYVTVICSDGEYIHTAVDSSISYGVTGQVYWKYDSNEKTLYIGGEGETPADHSNVSGSNPAPWAQFIPEMVSVVVEEGVTTLGQNLLRDAKNLLNVSLPNTLKSIGQATFRDCDALLSITIPESVEVLTRTAFYDCDMLREVTLGGTYTYLTDKLFQGCINLRKITIPGTVTYIDSNAFGSCAQVNTIIFGGTRSEWYKVLTHSKSLGASAIKKDYIKVYCTDGLYIDGFTSIENGLVYKIADGVLMIMGDGAIADYTVGNAPWSERNGEITTVILYSGITGVGENAFADCINLASAVYQGDVATLMPNIKSGNDYLLAGFENTLLSGTCGANATWSLDAASGKMTISGIGAIYNYESRKVTPWTNYANLVTELVIEEGITRIGEYAFNSFRNLEMLTLPSTLEILDVYCFGICPSLTTLTIPEGVRIIASKVFNTCSGITTIYLPSTLEYVDMKAFEGATSITDVYYNGSQMEWNAITISINDGGNDYLLNANIHVVMLPEYTDIASDAWYAADINYLLDNMLAEIDGEAFGVNETENLELVLTALYNRAKIQRSYKNALSWAINCGLVDRNAPKELTLQTLAQLLLRMACYNVYSEELLQDVTNADAALAWCEAGGFANALLQNTDDLTNDTVLTRGQVCSVLAAFLKNSTGMVNRYEKLIGTVRTALASGGDGKLYILPINIHEDPDGGGDGTFVLFPNGETMLIDSFSSADNDALLSVLEAIGVKNLDHMVLSHGHADHIGCAQNVVNWIYDNGGTVSQYWSAGYIYPASTEDDLIALLETKGVTLHTNVREGDQFKIGDVVIDIYHPSQAALDAVTAGGDYANEYINNTSMVMKFTYGASTFLTSGDLHSNQEYKLATQFGSALQADVMKSNHHGTYTSNGATWMNTVKPKILYTHAEDLGEATFYEDCLANGSEFYSAGLDGLILISMGNAADYAVLTQFGAEAVVHVCQLEKVDAIDATCMNPGNVEYYACSCGLKYADEAGQTPVTDVEIPALGHKDENKDHICDNTDCTVYQGEHADSATDNDHICDYCAQEIENGETCVDVLTDDNHDCDICGKENVTEHQYHSSKVKPTCTRAGYTRHICDCGDSYKSNWVDALDHADEDQNHLCDRGCGEYLGEHVDSPTDSDHVCDYCGEAVEDGEVCADVNTDGDHNCDVCGKENVTEHSYDAVITAPTCTEPGFTTYTCNCGHSYAADEAAAIGHAWDSGKVTKPADCENNGVKTYSCTHDGSHTKTETISATGHSWSRTSDDHFHWQVCEVCSATKDQQAHSFDDEGVCACGVHTPETPNGNKLTIAIVSVLVVAMGAVATFLVIKRKKRT